MPYAQTNNINLYYELHGRGEPLVLIPGLGYDGWMWHRMIPGLAEHYQVISIDNRGVGQSDKPPGPYTAQMLAADVVGLLDALGLPKAHVMGHSMGGFVA
ncbi:MAG TPA: alpha/beta fold hydrolase, partial [Promineifilum sp.]|nr:alpha/beta fold hydrolase [Promineifilum sp.]